MGQNYKKAGSAKKRLPLPSFYSGKFRPQLRTIMKRLKNLFFIVLAVCSLTLTGCLNILEEVTFRNSGAGAYKMVIDMGQAKGMLDMLKTMKPDVPEGDSTGTVVPETGNPMGQLGTQMSEVANSIKGIQGISNVVEIANSNDFKFGYAFDFADVGALNRALRVLGKEKYDSKIDEVFKFDGKKFERLNEGDMGAEMRKMLGEAGAAGEDGEEGAGAMGTDMMMMFFKDMQYEQVYHFPDRVIKKNDNKLGEISTDKHTISIKIKPFDEKQQKEKASVGTKIRLK